MRPSCQTTLLVALCITLGFGIANFVSTPTAAAQQSAAVSAARFQISAFPGDQGRSGQHGAYVIDTMSGKVWYVRATGGAPSVVAQTLQ